MSAVVAPVRGPQHRVGWTSVRRATALVLWQAAPWVLVVLVVLSVLGAGNMVWSTWRSSQVGGAVVVQGDGGVAAGISIFVLLATLVSWTRTVRTAVPVLVAGGVTRRAATGGLLIGAAILAVVTDALLVVVALAGAALQRAVVARSAATAVPPPDSDAYSSSLTIRYDAPEVLYNPVEILPWFVMAALGGVLVGAAWYRWRALGALGVAAALLAAGIAYHLVVGAAVMSTSSAVVDAAGSLPQVEVVPCLALALAAWLVLRRVPLRPPAR